MPDHLNIVTAQIVGYFVTSVLYGLYLYTFFQCLYALLRSRSGWKGYSDIHWGVVVVTLTFFVNGTFNISLGLLRLIQQFSLNMGPVVWVNTVKVSNFEPSYLRPMLIALKLIFQSFTVNLQTMIGEGVMVRPLE
jgi:hypothetical protein